MKKVISGLLSMAVAMTSLAAAPLSSDAAGDIESIAVFGDSIADGYGRLGYVEHNYGQLVADYLGSTVQNYAVPGQDSAGLKATIAGLDDAQKDYIKNSDVILISIGGNDMINYAAEYLIDFALKYSDDTYQLLADGYNSKEDIPDDLTLEELMNILNINGDNGIKAFAKDSKNLITLNGKINTMKDEIVKTLLPETTIPNIQESVNALKEINPDAKIIVQNIYQPLQVDPSFITSTYGASSSASDIIGILRSKIDAMTNKGFNQLITGVEGIEVADVYYQFTALGEGTNSNDKNPGNAHYFVDVQTESLSTADFHPNQKGHLAIATAILKQLNDLHVDTTSLMYKTYTSLSDKEDYPEIALNDLKLVIGEDEKSETTTTTTTAITTTTTVTSTTTTAIETTTTTTAERATTTTTTTETPTTTTTTDTNISYGDVNGDNLVDARDASNILAEYAALSTNKDSIFNDEQTAAADLDKNDIVDARDASNTLAFYAYSSVSTHDPVTMEVYLKDILKLENWQ